MRISWQLPTLIILLLIMSLIGCNNGQYSNPTSPPVSPSEWRFGQVDSVGMTFDMSEIGLFITFPAGAIPDGEVFSFQARTFPPDVPMLPSGPVFVRLGTFEIKGNDVDFQQPVEVRFKIAEARSPGVFSRGFVIDGDYLWASYGNAPVLSDGLHAMMTIYEQGVFGSFEAVPLHVEATVSQQDGPVPLSPGFKAIITGGYPPYQAIWVWGDNEDPGAGFSVSHQYVDPGDYTVTVMVTDYTGAMTTDWVHLTAYNQSGPPFI